MNENADYISIPVSEFEEIMKDAKRMREIDEAVANDSLASDGMEMIQAAMRDA